MVDQFELEDIALDLFDMLRIEQHLHPLQRRRLASRNQRRAAVFNAHQAHSAVAVGAQGRVVAEMRDLDADCLEGIDQVLARLDFHFLAIHKKLHHISHGSSYPSQQIYETASLT
jgi:hypothetical protein